MKIGNWALLKESIVVGRLQGSAEMVVPLGCAGTVMEVQNGVCGGEDSVLVAFEVSGSTLVVRAWCRVSILEDKGESYRYHNLAKWREAVTGHKEIQT